MLTSFTLNGLKNMNIIQVPRRFVKSHWGGTETVILETCKKLQAMGHTSRIICPNALATKNKEIIDGIEVTRTPYFYPYFGLSAEAGSLLDLKGGNLFSFSLMKALKKETAADIFHLHTAKRIGGIGRYVAKKRKIPYVVSLHGGLLDVPPEEAATWTEPTRGALEWGKLLGMWVGSRRVMDDAAAIICVGEGEREKTQRAYPGKKVVHLPNGVNPGRFLSGDGTGFRNLHGIPSDAYVVLNIGRIDPQKNQLFLIKHLSKLAKLNPKTHLLLIGPVTHEDYYKEIIDYISISSIESSVTVIPGLDSSGSDLTNAYHAADLFVLPSIHEPFGIVILEAWAAGLPVVASKVGGVPSFVIPEKDGLLFEPNNPDSLVEKFRFILENPEQTKKMSNAGRQKARDEYSWDVISKRLLDLYEEAIRENPFRK
jgi:glycosyltransferase involved in cell wall biosynthesis